MKKPGGWMWIGDKKQETEAAFVMFRGTFQWTLPSQTTILHITADSRYKLYVNGYFAEMGPSRGNNQIWYLDTIDLAPYLQPGRNTLAVIVMRYPTSHWKGNCGIFRTEMPGLYVETDITISWRCKRLNGTRVISENPYFAPLQFYEQAEGSLELAGWMEKAFDDSLWDSPVYYVTGQIPAVLQPEALVPRTIPYLYRKQKNFIGVTRGAAKEKWNRFLAGNTPVEVPPNGEISIDIDAGELMTGYLRLKMAGGAGARVKLLQAECYAGDIVENEDPYRSLPQKGDRADASLQLYGYTDTYRVCGFGSESAPEQYEPFWFRTFRYIRLSIETGEEPLRLLSFDYEETGYPLSVISAVKTSDSTMDRVWEISERSLRRCMHETYEDCPFYEQLQYTMDTRSQILYTYAVSADSRLAVKAMDDFSRSARPDGMINCSYPNFETNVIPGFAIYYIGMVYDYMMYFGHRERIRQYMPTIDGILRFFRNHLDEKGIVEKVGDLNGSGRDWSFIDWAPGWEATTGVPPCTRQGPITMESLLFILGLQYTAELADYLGDDQKAAECRRDAEKLQNAVNLWCRGRAGLYQDGPGVESYSQHTQVFAVLTGTVSVQQGKMLIEETLVHPEKYEQCTIAMMFYLFRALEKCGLYHHTAKLWDLWRDMVKNNLTTCAEKPLMSRSDCHAWGALALYELPTVILGVRPAKPGYKKILVSPRTETLAWAEGTAVTPHGPVRVMWRKENGKTALHAEGPEGIPITIRNE